VLRRHVGHPATGAVGRGHVPDCAGWGRLPTVRLTDFWDRMDQVFGPAYARSWAHDVVLPDLGLTAVQAIDAGMDTKEVWRAVCTTTEVPGVLR
jgi:hypothetical protein